MRMHRAFGSAGCARGVNDHHRVFRRGVLGRRVIKWSGQSCWRPCIWTEVLDEPFAGLVENNKMPQRWNLRSRFVGDRFHRAEFPPPISSSRSEERFRFGIVQSRHNRPGAETGEERQENSADFNDGEHCDYSL